MEKHQCWLFVMKTLNPVVAILSCRVCGKPPDRDGIVFSDCSDRMIEWPAGK
jgi:hypothetical protein